ncbi:MAG: lysozyme inhibitor LprI family protein [Succinivibrio sp.]
MSIIFKLASALLVIASLNQLSLADENKVEEEFNSCMEAADGSPINVTLCYEQSIDYWDKRANKAYEDAIANATDDEFKKDLIQSQRAWILYKETFAKLLYLSQDGSVASSISSAYILKATRMQAKNLEELAYTLKGN